MSTIAAGTTSTTALVSTGDTTGKLTFQTNGTTTAMTIDTSQNVGIGTSSPAAKLEIDYAATGNGITSPFDQETLVLKNTNSTANNCTSIQARNAGGGAVAAINFINVGTGAYPNNGGGIAFATYAGSGAGGTTKMYLDPSGNVSVAVDKYVAFSLNDANSRIQAASGSGYMEYRGYSGHIFYDTATGSERMRITSAGNVGIGTSSPGRRLTVQTPTATATLNSTAAVFSDFTNATMELRQSTTENSWYSNTAMAFATNNGEKVRIDSSGNVQVGTSSQLYSSKLTVEAGTANATTYTTIATKGGSSMAHQQQSTTGVSTSLVTILTPGTGPYAAFCVVFGSDGTNRFIDLVLFSVGTGTINVISSLSAAGSPAARTYAQNSSTLQLSMGSGTYTVQVTTIGMGS